MGKPRYQNKQATLIFTPRTDKEYLTSLTFLFPPLTEYVHVTVFYRFEPTS